MRLTTRNFVVLLLAAVFVCGPGIEAASVLQMNLGSLCDRSDKVFRGRVMDSTAETVAAGGGEIPVVTYTIAVEEEFKGDFGPKPVVTLRLLGSKTALVPVGGDIQRVSAFAGLPVLSVGQEYLLFTTQPSAIGLSTTVGLGHGCFHISAENKEELVVNEFDNVGIFAGFAGMPASGPVTYDAMAAAIHDYLY